MLIAAGGSCACGSVTWIVVATCVPSTAGLCEMTTVPVFAASAAFANASVASAAAAARGGFFMCGISFRLRRGQRLPEDVPEAVAVLHEIRLADREIVGRRRGELEAVEEERVRRVQVLRGLQEARAREVFPGPLQRVDGRVRGHHPVDVR